MARTESLNDFQPKHYTLQNLRIAAIRDIIAYGRQDSTPKDQIKNEVHAYCIEKNLEVSDVTIDMDEDIESIVVKTPDTAYYFRL